MNEQTSGFESISDHDLERIDVVCDRFQASLREGDPARIEKLVADAPDDARLHLVHELVEMEVHFRQQRGEMPTAEEYLGRFPDCAEALSELFRRSQPLNLSADTRPSVHDATPPSGLPPIQPDLPFGRGTRLGTYELVSLLGQGGMGTVYRARHTMLGRTVALKVLLPGLLSRGEAVNRFEAEIRSLGPLDHKNIVHAVDADESGGYYFYVMDFVPGVDLQRVSKRLGPLPVADACELIRQAAVGLEYLHENDIVHRDIKPANLMVCAGLEEHGVVECTRRTTCCQWSPLVKILDMGLVRFRHWREENEPITSTGQVLGTIDFMAPEQLDDSHEVDVRADIYSLGATLYQLLTGRPPYPSASHLNKLKSLATVAPPSVSSLRPELPGPLVAAVDRMLKRDVADRFQTPAQVAEALAPFTQGADIRALARQVPRRDEPLPPSPSEVAAGRLIPVEEVRVLGGSEASGGGGPPRGSKGTPVTLPDAPPRQVSTAMLGLVGVVVLGTIIAAAAISGFPKDDGDVATPGSVVDSVAGQETNVLQSNDPKANIPEIIRVDPAITHSDLPLEKVFQGATGPVTSLVFPGDGSVLVSGDRGGAVRMWDVASGLQRNACADLEPVIAVAVSPDQRLIAAGTIGQGITIIQLSDARQVRTMADDMRHVLGLDWSPDGRWLLSSDYSGSAIARDMEQEGQSKLLVERTGRVESVRFSRDGSVALVAGDRHGLSVWSVPQWIRLVEIAEGCPVAAISPSGDRVATRGTVFDTTTGAAVTSYEASHFPIEVTFTPDGRHIISCETTFALAIVEVATGQIVARIEMNTPSIDALAVSPDGRYVFTAGGHVYNAQTKEFVDSGDYTIRMWRLPETVWPKTDVVSNRPQTRLLPPADSGDEHAGATITVNTDADVLDGDTSSIANLIANPGDDGAISLREAIIAANNTDGNDTIEVAAAGTTTLSIAGTEENAAATGDLDITSSLTIQGSGARTTIMDGGGIDRVFEIVAHDVNVNLRDLIIRGGSSDFGGGIHIRGADSRINLDRVRVTDNHTTENAGGINIAGDHPTMIVNIRNLLIDNNVSAGENGGGTGGIVLFPAGTVSIVNSTVSGNTGVSAGGILAQFNGGGSLEIENSTITANVSTFPITGGIQKNDITGTVTLTNSIIAGNSGDQFRGDAGAVIESGGHNIVGPGSKDFHALGSDMEFDGAIDTLLHPLADNGGPTDTHALAAGGIAINAGSETVARESGLSTDQRGNEFQRIVNESVDIGAFEFAP